MERRQTSIPLALPEHISLGTGCPDLEKRSGIRTTNSERRRPDDMKKIKLNNN
jgi:hypothetical protein